MGFVGCCLVILSLLLKNEPETAIPRTRNPLLETNTVSAATMNQYTSLIQKLYNYNIMNPVKMGLDNSKKLYNLFNRPLEGVPIVHVAGTNGKGSVSLKTAECLRRGGLRTGLFVSPHISSFRERIQVNGVPMAEEAVLDLLPKVFSMCETHAIPATFFELTCSLAFVAFQRASCEAVVLEVGLGGRLDSTNVINPNLSVITSIQLDHTKILGDTIEKIAMEKAGIMKPGVDVLVGPGCPIELLRSEAQRVGAPFYTLSDVLEPSELSYTEPKGDEDFADIDNLNSDIARAAIRLLKKSSAGSCNEKWAAALAAPGIEDGLKIRPPCRFEIFTRPVMVSGVTMNVDVILDIAHNEDAMIALVRKVNGLYTSLDDDGKEDPNRVMRVVLGMSSDKDVQKCLAPVLRLTKGRTDHIYCVAARHPRAMPPAELRELISQRSSNNAMEQAASQPELTIREAVLDALNEVANEAVSSGVRPRYRPVVVVCGTAFIMAEARCALGVVEPKDGDTLSDAIASATSGGGQSGDTLNANLDAQECFRDVSGDKQASSKE